MEQEKNNINIDTDNLPKTGLHFFDENTCYLKAKAVAFEISKLCKHLLTKKDYTVLNPILNQLVRSSTSVYANLAEGCVPLISSKDRAFKFRLACKEALETISWLQLLEELGEISPAEAGLLTDEVIQITKILLKSLSTMKRYQ